MFKKLSVFLVLVLVIGALSACSGGPGTNSLDKETKEAVENAWYERGESWKWVNSKQEKGYCYYGNFGGYDIVFAGSGKDTLETQRIGGFVFEYGTGCQLYAYKDEACTILQTNTRLCAQEIDVHFSFANVLCPSTVQGDDGA